MPSESSAGRLATFAANPSSLRVGFAWMRSRRRTTVARCSSAASTTSSRRCRSCSSSVTGAPQHLLQPRLVALEDGERFLEERVNPLLDLADIEFPARLDSIEVLEGRIRAHGSAAIPRDLGEDKDPL